MMPIAMELTIARSRLGCCQILWNVASDSSSHSDTPTPQLEIKARSATPSSGTPMVTVSQATTTALATQRHLPSGSARAWDALPFMVTKRLAVRISRRWSITSGMVMQISTTATAAIRW
ncbi:Uncharacterised protein [Klebsiella pneumoniae]|uniref:Uncharacterized protein n=1 Tax=Klebsiella pneumoniae TaxID=573 RepID=A0A447S821_KLEPN|nr:Uncharacterised protein [Klebsiella pneumoniae]